MSNKKVLVVDDEKNITFVIKAILEKGGFKVDTQNNPLEALKALSQPDHGYSAVITDLYMPEMNGMVLLDEIKSTQPELPVIMITAFGTVESAVEALKKGAFDYVTKPFEQGEILAIAEKASNTFGLRQREPFVDNPEQLITHSVLIGKSPQMQDVHRVIQKVASSPSTVLITGESGTGKEIVAVELHRLSDRADKPFIKINCAAIPHNLIESELFGYEKGAFTGAVNSKPGRFELAHQGTIFLDEVADMPMEMQVKLLRSIQEQEFERVGGLQTIKIDVRIIAATNKDIQKEIREGRFREDLFYRLNVVPISLAPLRERRADIEDLVYFFTRKFNERLHKHIETIDQVCLQRLLTFSWPGNIRQLENVLERAVLMSEGNILRLQDLPAELVESTDGSSEEVRSEVDKLLEAYQKGMPYKDIIRQQTQNLERAIIEEALTQNAGNITRTAERLGLSRKGLQLKLKELGMAAPRGAKED